MTHPSGVTEHHRYLIIGAGPAGLQLSYYLQQAGCDYATVERAEAPGEFFRRFPRHRGLISLNKVHTVSTDPEIRLRWDWNSLLHEPFDLPFADYSRQYYPSADDMVRYLVDFAAHHRLAIRYGVAVDQVTKQDGIFLAHTADRIYSADCLIMATGWGRPNIPDVPGIEHAVGYESMSTDPADYAGQRVLILGKGNSAFETASAILGHASMVHLASPRPMRLAWNTKHPGDVRGHHGAVMDSYQFKTLHSVLDCVVDEIVPTGEGYRVHLTYTHADGETAVMDYESVLRCTGFAMDTSVFGAGARPRLVPSGRMPATAPDWQSVDVDGLYFAGTIAQDRDFKKASSAFVDGFRYNLRTLTALLRERYEGVPLPFDTVPADAETLTGVLLDRVNWSSALWTQFEFLVDAVVVDPGTGQARHYHDLPEDLVAARFADEEYCYTFGLRWGRDPYPDVFAIERHPQPDRAAESAFIHPVLRRYRHGELVDELHLLEDLLAEWRRPDRHVLPLQDHLAKDLPR
ncbi:MULTISPECIES: NAD(P)-binding domain-containing protein [unclassified Solwaraspora]|uniref:NAD(P)-binding domain-containing protein n=1 Tax=unclassified Solwaraspora TaxID=2627926 RepID=UPI00259BF1B1|nr:NAD(P)-binding domain-containing protein [Solwaraspora sp. WMMA2056]WJK42646.1 NAD(P)-binding domain-containing protein [Solwaraspora sp. WMMA2056]